MSGLVTGLQNRAQRFESASDLPMKASVTQIGASFVYIQFKSKGIFRVKITFYYKNRIFKQKMFSNYFIFRFIFINFVTFLINIYD